MPDRILRAAILTSERVDKLSCQAEVLYRRLMSVIDDFGRYDARVSVLRASLFPLRIDRVNDVAIGKWLTECVAAGLVSVYTVDGKEYLQVERFDQRIRAQKSKFPAPTDAIDKNALASEKCGHLTTSADICGHPPPYSDSYAQSKSYSETESNKCPPDGERENVSDLVEKLYLAFPRKVQPKNAKAAIAKALKKVTFDELMSAVMEFAESPKGKGDYCPYPATWFNAEQWNDDRNEWQRGNGNTSGRASPYRGGPGQIHKPADGSTEPTGMF